MRICFTFILWNMVLGYLFFSFIFLLIYYLNLVYAYFIILIVCIFILICIHHYLHKNMFMIMTNMYCWNRSNQTIFLEKHFRQEKVNNICIPLTIIVINYNKSLTIIQFTNYFKVKCIIALILVKMYFQFRENLTTNVYQNRAVWKIYECFDLTRLGFVVARKI